MGDKALMNPDRQAPAGAEIDIDAIEARARAATQGEWRAHDDDDVIWVDVAQSEPCTVIAWAGFDSATGAPEQCAADAAHIAALHPGAVLAWAGETRRLRRIEAAARAWIAHLEGHGKGLYRDGIPGDLIDALNTEAGTCTACGGVGLLDDEVRPGEVTARTCTDCTGRTDGGGA